MKVLRRISLAAVLLLSACLPSLQLPEETVLPQASSALQPFADFQTYFERSGSAENPPILLIHGIGGGSSLFQYRKNTTALSQAGYQVFAIDLLGFGRSSRPAMRVSQDLHVAQIQDFIETVIGQPAIIVANGLSAAYSIRLAAERPELIRALLLIAPAGLERLNRPQTEDRIRQFDTFSGILGDLLFGILAADNWQEFFLLDAYGGPESLTPEVRSEFNQQIRAPNAKWIVLSFISGNLDQDVADFWPRVSQPSRIVWGEDATNTPLRDAEAFLLVRPEVELVTFSQTKLLPNEDQPERFNQVLLEFLASLD